MASIGRRGVLAGALGLAGLAAAGCAQFAPGRMRSGAELAPILARGGHVIVLTHAQLLPVPETAEPDRPDLPPELQRNLSPEGRGQAQQIGARFRSLGIPVAEIRTSPFQRCIDTAQLAFGQASIDQNLLSVETLGGPPRRSEYLRGLLARRHGLAGNLVAVTHRANVLAATGVVVGDAEALVVEPQGIDRYALIGQVRAGDW